MVSFGAWRIDGRRVGDCSRFGLASLCRVGVYNGHTLCRVSSGSGMSWLTGLGGVARVAGVSRLAWLARFAGFTVVSGTRGIVVGLRRRLRNGVGVDGYESINGAAGLCGMAQLVWKGIGSTGVVDDTVLLTSRFTICAGLLVTASNSADRRISREII